MPLTECLRHVSRHTSVLRHVRVLSFATPPTLLAIAPSPEQCSAPEPHASFQFDTVLREPPQTDVLRRKPPQPAGDFTPLHFFQRSQQPQRNHQHPFHPPPGRAITSLLPHHPTHPSPLHHPPGARGVRSVAVAEEEGGQRYRTVASVGPHTVVSDMVNGEEGADSAPTAMEYALAALGLCTSMTVRLYADRKGLPLKRIHVKVNPDLPSPASHLPRSVHLALHFEGDLTAEQRQHLLFIASKSLVNKALSGELHSEIVATLVEGKEEQ